jgi:hypothetical protein
LEPCPSVSGAVRKDETLPQRQRFQKTPVPENVYVVWNLALCTEMKRQWHTKITLDFVWAFFSFSGSGMRCK